MNKITKTYNLNGRLELKDDADYEYILKNGDIETNLTEILNNAYKLNKPVIYMTVEMKGRQIINEEGYLHRKHDANNIICYFLDGYNTDKFLFNHTGEFMNIFIKIEVDTEDMN